jgi:hypothetical protein
MLNSGMVCAVAISDPQLVQIKEKRGKGRKSDTVAK